MIKKIRKYFKFNVGRMVKESSAFGSMWGISFRREQNEICVYVFFGWRIYSFNI